MKIQILVVLAFTALAVSSCVFDPYGDDHRGYDHGYDHGDHDHGDHDHGDHDRNFNH